MKNSIKSILNESLLTIHYIDEVVILAESLNEEKGPDMQWDYKNNKFYDYNKGIVKDITNKIDSSTNRITTKEAAINFFNILKRKVDNLPILVKRGIIKYSIVALGGLIGLNTLMDIKPDYINQNELTTMVKPAEKDVEPEVEKPEEKPVEVETKFKDPATLKLSQEGWDFIKDEEKLRLKAYNIGDGRITVGWGHAEPIKTSKYKEGDTISKQEAQNLIQKDAGVAADGIRRMFRQWKEKGADVKITQNMFDALVSLAFNSGVGGVRRSDFVKELKKGNYDKAAELIKTHRLRKGFGGLVKRRAKEAELFAK